MQDVSNLKWENIEREFENWNLIFSIHFITTWHRSCHALAVLYWRENESGAIVCTICFWNAIKLRTMNKLISLARSTSVLQRAVSQRKPTSLIRSFSPTTATCNAPQKFTEEEVAASVRLLTYQGTPFPWVAVSDDCVDRCAWKSQLWRIDKASKPPRHCCLFSFLRLRFVPEKRKQGNHQNFYFCGFQSSVVFHESNSLVGRKNGPPSRMVQRVQSSGSNINHARLRRRLKKGSFNKMCVDSIADIFISRCIDNSKVRTLVHSCFQRTLGYQHGKSNGRIRKRLDAGRSKVLSQSCDARKLEYTIIHIMNT